MVKFHITRTRARGTPDWFDPSVDLRRLLPAVFDLVEYSMLDAFPEDSPEQKDVQYIHDCRKVLEIRLLEDPSGVSSQLTGFFRAIAKVRVPVRFAWLERVVSTITCLYGLFVRRDSATDKPQLRAMVDYAWLSPLKQILSPATWQAVQKELGARASLLVQNNVEPYGGSAYRVEADTFIDDIKRIALSLTSQTGAESWEELATACDRAFKAGKARTTEEAAALALAYPSYENPSTMAVYYGPGGEDKKPADPGEPGAV